MKVSYYPGCSLDGTAREYGESVEAVCETLGVELKELADWNCCGSSSAHATNYQLALSLSARNLKIAEKASMDVLVPCAACYQRLKVAEKALLDGVRIEGIAPKYSGDFHIKHLADFYWNDVGEKVVAQKVKRPLGGLNVVAYYGCLTTRPPKVTGAAEPEDPKAMDELLKTLGATVKNWSFKTDCCGGNLILTRPDIAKKLIQKLLEMAQEAEADAIVTACPMCLSNLDTRQAELLHDAGKKYDIPVFYISELMGLAFGDPSAQKWLGRHLVDPMPLLREKGLI